MNDVEIIDIDENTKVFIFSVDKNIAMANLSMVPKYREDIDKTKRLLARVFLFEHCKKHYGLEDFSFEYTDKGRPKFKNSEIDFSISYSKDIIGVAISTKPKIGLDIEFLEPLMVSDRVALEFMSSDEFLTFSKLINDDKKRYFYEVWTSKESFLKAKGDGLYTNPKGVVNTKGQFFYFKNFIASFTRI
ncbi:MAG: 4'-phosphopantetheinyl transferase superfamily protein [Campylobacterota bacterium]|nr:4'-phosphopantetheinyl transferase superfamily protein [Campylobacterota bacterium]